MKTIFSMAMRKAANLAKSQHVIEATRVIQHALAGPNRSRSTGEHAKANVELKRQELGGHATLSAEAAAGRAPGRAENTSPEQEHTRAAKPLGEVLTLLRQVNPLGPSGKLFRHPPISPPVPDGASFLSSSFTCAAGSRDYKVYVPSAVPGGKRPLIVMLHGCTQNPDDFASGTGMNSLAEQHGFITAYPGQAAAANHSACWNWFNLKDQMRDAGEPSIIAGITRTIIAEYDIDPGRVYVAGLSAGGAMALVMSANYPDLYAAAGVHSGLPYRLATDLPSAFAAMRGEPVYGPAAQTKRRPKNAEGYVRTIVFHGDADRTVSPSNAALIVSEMRTGLGNATEEIQRGRSSGGRAYTRISIRDQRGVVRLEHWTIAGLAHAWSGGRQEGSYTDPNGPDASQEMVRFFLDRSAP